MPVREGDRLVGMITDGRVGHHINGATVSALAKLGTFSEHMLVSQDSVVKVDSDYGWGPAALVSCSARSATASSRPAACG